MVDGMAAVMKRRGDVGLVVCGGTGHSDPGVWPAVQQAIQRHGVADRICFVDDLDHDAFLSALERSAVYLRTPITDGVASSVLESLALGVPVVACANGTRPANVITYQADDAAGLAVAVESVIGNRPPGRVAVPFPDLPDTVSDEISVLTC
jgi:glycosyltransferase involved in cell wall biosynthesis